MANFNPTNTGTTARSMVHDHNLAISVMHNMLLSNGYTRGSSDPTLFTKGTKQLRVFSPTDPSAGVVSVVKVVNGVEQLLSTHPLVDDQMNALQGLL